MVYDFPWYIHTNVSNTTVEEERTKTNRVTIHSYIIFVVFPSRDPLLIDDSSVYER